MKQRLIIAIVIVVLLLGASLAYGQGRDTAPQQSWECQANQTCHLLLYPGSKVYILTADGRIDMEVYGHDSILVEDVSNTR